MFFLNSFDRSQFEKSENAENNIKTTATNGAGDGEPNAEVNQSSASGSASGSNSGTTNGPIHSTVIDIHTAPSTKTNETASKFSVKKPGTPKVSTPREILLATLDVKSKLDTHAKDKIKFNFKHGETATESSTKQTEDPAKDTTAKPSANVNNSNSPLVSVSNNNGRTSSCVIDLKTVWFNFAAPPRAPITRKIDFTRLVMPLNAFFF